MCKDLEGNPVLSALQRLPASGKQLQDNALASLITVKTAEKTDGRTDKLSGRKARLASPDAEN
jgi:hypothetical protein